MAEEDKDLDLDTDGEEGGGKSKKKLIIIILLALIVLGGGGGAAFFLMGGEEEKKPTPEASQQAGEGAEGAEGEEGGEAKPTVNKEPARYVPLGPTFVVNFISKNGNTGFLQVAITALTRKDEVFILMKKHNPLIRNNVVIILSGRTFKQLDTFAGKERLRADVLQAVNKVSIEKLGYPGVETVFFTEFVMQ